MEDPNGLDERCVHPGMNVPSPGGNVKGPGSQTDELVVDSQLAHHDATSSRTSCNMYQVADDHVSNSDLKMA